MPPGSGSDRPYRSTRSTGSGPVTPSTERRFGRDACGRRPQGGITCRNVASVNELGPGLYEQLVTEGLRAQLDELVLSLPIDERPLNSSDASDRIAWHVGRQVEQALLDVSDEQRVRVGVEVARALLGRLGELVDVDRQ